MEKRWYDGSTVKISDIQVHVSERQVTLNFKWPNELEMIYIYKTSLLKEEEINEDKPYRKYTKNEYSSFGGFVDQNVEGGLFRYTLSPYITDGCESYLLQYKDKCNEVDVIASKIEIRYHIHEKKKWFSSRKTVQMQIFCDVDLPKDYLCYVKKKGTIPIGPEDGMCFQFVDDFKRGNNILPEIEVEKDEYVRIYLSKEVPHQEVYKVIKG